MKNIYCFLLLVMFLSGCATKMAYLNTQKPPEEFKKDKTDCQAVVDSSDSKDAGLKQKKFNQCMKDKGYNVVSEDKAEKIQGFKGLWIRPGADFKIYEAIFIDKVDLSRAKVKNTKIPDTKIADEDINNLGEEMLERFSKTLGFVMSVIPNREEAAGKKVLYISLKLNDISQTNVGFNTALEAAGHFSPVPLPEGPEGTFSFEGIISDFSTQERLITISDEVKADKNSSLAGLEKFEHWKKAYNIMDYWADRLTALLAKERGQKYKSRLGFKLIDF
ncbi:MAG: DUF3313 family protein [Candidatus Omnitrophica bacterium]|nr:DUF3313 family protein [Candidatus Omnitrophota bacterium]MDD5592776.1 DUF3313 family protein [Candidatus Omnitrophota bacterium]